MLAVWRTKPAKPVIDKLAILHHGKTITLAGRQKSAKLAGDRRAHPEKTNHPNLGALGQGGWRVAGSHWRGWQQLPQMIKRPAGNIWFAPIGKQHLMIGELAESPASSS